MLPRIALLPAVDPLKLLQSGKISPLELGGEHIRQQPSYG